jgi:fatty acid desaturase
VTRDDARFYGKMMLAGYLMVLALAVVIGLLLGLVAWLGGWGFLIWVLAFPPMLFAAVVVADKYDRWV